MLSRPTKALVYADWCAIRPLQGRYLLLFGLWCPLMALFVADGEPDALGEETWGRWWACGGAWRRSLRSCACSRLTSPTAGTPAVSLLCAGSARLATSWYLRRDL